MRTSASALWLLQVLQCNISRGRDAGVRRGCTPPEQESARVEPRAGAIPFGKLGSALMGSLQIQCVFDRGTFGVLPLTKSARAYLFPQYVKTNYSCSGPISVDPICPRPTIPLPMGASGEVKPRRRAAAAQRGAASFVAASGGSQNKLFILHINSTCIYIYIYIYTHSCIGVSPYHACGSEYLIGCYAIGAHNSPNQVMQLGIVSYGLFR